jgi:rare lipoprotein A
MKFFLLNFFFFFFCVIVGKTQDSLSVNTAKKPKVVTGIASFYSLNLTGTKTATGERFDNKNMTAASNSFKLNTWVRVTNLRNNTSVIVRINDRMSKHLAKKGRVIDLSRTAARKLKFMKRGLVKVRVEEVDKDTLQ